MIKKHIASFSLVTLLVFGGIGQTLAVSSTQLEPLKKHRISTVLITRLIEQYHYKQTRLNDEQSLGIYEEYLKTLDPNRSVFTQEDIDQFSKYELILDDTLLRGDLRPAFEMFRKFSERRIERAEYALKRLEKPFVFSVDETYLFDREGAAWPKDEKALDEIWRKRIKNDYLTLLLAGKEEKELKETLRKRYKRLKKRSGQFNEEDAYEFFINAYLRNMEPHTAYFSPRTSENFNINMSLSLEGIGAVLQTVDEHTVVRRVVKGGPADLSRQLHSGDKIIGVGQGEGKVLDIVGWRLDDVVDKIRGPKDSTVQLHILPEKSGPGGADKYISIVRNKIKLEDQQVQKSILEISVDSALAGGKKIRKIGVIEIPTFYMDFAAAARGDADFRSTTRDTKKLIKELQAENIEGLVIDLRRNGGGSLTEAVSLTGLFIKQGPVVQIRKSNGDLKIDRDEDKSIAYHGPLVVLVDRNSASASEIFSGAIKDYKRGIVVGEPTFGKGTVQSILNLNNYIKGRTKDLGQVKITMAQFFRVNGESTQHRGVVPDIVFPTAVESDDQGERSLENALPWAKIPPAKFVSSHQVPDDLNEIKAKFNARVKEDSGFDFFLAQAKMRDEVINKKEISLLQTERKAEREQRKKDRNELLNTFRKSRGLKEVALNDDEIDDNDTDLPIDDEDENKEKTASEKLSDELGLVPLREAAHILVDMISAR